MYLDINEPIIDPKMNKKLLYRLIYNLKFVKFEILRLILR